MGLRSRIVGAFSGWSTDDSLLAAGIASLVVGVAFIYWPAALVVLGIALIVLGAAPRVEVGRGNP